MKAYEIYDDENKIFLGVLLYYEKDKSFVIELQENLDEWTAPLLLASYAKKKVFTIPKDVSLTWVRERVIPSGRQNISDILVTHKLKAYDEMTFLELSEGRCSHDSIYIKRMEKLSKFVLDRMGVNITQCVMTGEGRMLCFFADEVVKLIDVNKLKHIDGVDKILNNKSLYESGKVSTGGYAVTFNDSIEIPAKVLYESGEYIPLKLQDFVAFVKNNVLDTSDACNVLECSRQNISYMVKQKQLTPICEDVKGNLYLKGDILSSTW